MKRSTSPHRRPYHPPPKQAPREDGLPPGTPRWAATLRRGTDYLSRDCLGGPRTLKLAWVINFQKAGTFPFLLCLLWWYDNHSTAAWIYTALHGSYGLAWLLKDVTFPDRSWQARVTWAGAANTFLGVLGWYWVFGWLMIARPVPAYPLPEPAWLALGVTLCLLGCVLMVAADAQKYFTLRARPGLISDGLHRYVRHPNYLGEMLVYGSFALLVWHWLPVVVLGWVWFGIFAVNMRIKEASMARHPDWEAYRGRTWWLVPFVLGLASVLLPGVGAG